MNHAPISTLNMLVAGDVVEHRFIYKGRQRQAGSAAPVGTICRRAAGGATLLANLLEAAARVKDHCQVSADNSSDHGAQPCLVQRWSPAPSKADAACRYFVMRPFPRLPKASEEAWRVAEDLGLSLGRFNGDRELNPARPEGDAARVVVIQDDGMDFRRWPAAEVWPRVLVEPNRPLPSWLVVKQSVPLAAGDLWHTLVSGRSQDREGRTIFDAAELLSRTIAVVVADDLRAESVQIARRLSWERTAADLQREFECNAALRDLRKLRTVVVSLGTDGAFVAHFEPGQPARYRLVFDPARLEGDFASEFEGTVAGMQECFTAALAWRMLHATARGDQVEAAIGEGVRAGLASMRRLLVEGHGRGQMPAAEFDGFPYEGIAREISGRQHEWAYGDATLPDQFSQSERWTIVAGKAEARSWQPLWGLAQRVALRGVGQLTQTPFLRFGKLLSIERTEIERYRTLQRLLIGYQRDLRAEKPLSIAVFGPPGSGKSFGVKELARAVFSDKVPLLEFNLSQFDQPAELHGLFHQIRDHALRGKLPVVFWDEFDSQDLKWLQYLLAPMQDGTFQDGQITHPIGKCVFIFAGGTRSQFEDFGNPPQNLMDSLAATPDGPARSRLAQQRDELLQQSVTRKVPDFKSRLAGYLNVLGPNPRGDDDLSYPVRRALLLRVHLGVADKQPLAIDPALLRAFLHIDAYRHGARSLEKIAEQVRLANRTGEFMRSDLPTRIQLDLHVDGGKFLALAGACL